MSALQQLFNATRKQQQRDEKIRHFSGYSFWQSFSEISSKMSPSRNSTLPLGTM